ncbi:hypothetical protein MTO96_041123 [Rhipicephalus appendiculatus]
MSTVLNNSPLSQDMTKYAKQRHPADHAERKRDQPRDRDIPAAHGTSTAETSLPVAAVLNEPPGSFVANDPAFAACPAYPQGAAIGPDAGMAFATEGLYFPPHYCFLPPGQTGVTAAVPAPPSTGHAPPVAAVQGRKDHQPPGGSRYVAAFENGNY